MKKGKHIILRASSSAIIGRAKIHHFHLTLYFYSKHPFPTMQSFPSVICDLWPHESLQNRSSALQRNYRKNHMAQTEVVCLFEQQLLNVNCAVEFWRCKMCTAWQLLQHHLVFRACANRGLSYNSWCHFATECKYIGDASIVWSSSRWTLSECCQSLIEVSCGEVLNQWMLHWMDQPCP